MPKWKSASGHDLASGHPRVFPRRRATPCFRTRGGMPVTMGRLNLVGGLGPGAANGRGLDRGPPGRGPRRAGPADRTRPGRPLVRAATDRRGRVPRRLRGDDHWGANHCVMSYGHVGADLDQRWRRCCGSRSTCTTSRPSRSSARARGRVLRHRRPGRRGFPGLRELRPALRPALSGRLAAPDRRVGGRGRRVDVSLARGR